MLNVKIEISKPYVKPVQTLPFSDVEDKATVKEISNIVNNIIQINLPNWRQNSQAFTEIRWEFVECRQTQSVDIREELANENEDIEVIKQMVPNLEPGDEYYKLAEAVKNGEVGFEANGQWIVNPFYDETLRDDVDPVNYYGYINLNEWL